jgi:hypothetical protein
MLASTGWWAPPNWNLVLNCAGFPRRLLRQKLQDGKRISSSGFVKRPMCNIRQNGWRITRGTQLKKRLLHLESCCHNKSHSGHKLTSSLRLDEHQPFLVVSNPCLTLLSSACTSFTPNHVYSLVHIQHRAISFWLHECLPVFYLVPCGTHELSRSIQYTT